MKINIFDRLLNINKHIFNKLFINNILSKQNFNILYK